MGVWKASTVRKLTNSWASDSDGPLPKLKGLSISLPFDAGLRGLRDINVDFGFPVVFLSGPNGTGKLTLLALSALAFHGIHVLTH